MGADFIAGYRSQGLIWIAHRRICCTQRVIYADLLHPRAGVQQRSPNRREDDSDGEEERKDGLGSQDGLPCFESLLSKRGVLKNIIISMKPVERDYVCLARGYEGGRVLAGLLLFCFFLSSSSLSRKLALSVCSIVCDMVVVLLRVEAQLRGL